jgi:hypothetical protein
MQILLLRICADSSSDLASKSGFAAAIICFVKEGILEKINLQREGNKAKVYQVRQVRAVLLKYKLGDDL